MARHLAFSSVGLCTHAGVPWFRDQVGALLSAAWKLGAWRDGTLGIRSAVVTSDTRPEPEQRRRPGRETSFPQSAVIPLREDADGLKLLLITNNSGSRWILPKGLVEEHLSPAESGATEAYEEAGIEGTVLPEPLGVYRYRKWGGVCSVEVFLMCVERELDDWPEAGFRRRRWVSLCEARRILDERVPRSILDALAKRLSS